MLRGTLLLRHIYEPQSVKNEIMTPELVLRLFTNMSNVFMSLRLVFTDRSSYILMDLYDRHGLVTTYMVHIIY